MKIVTIKALGLISLIIAGQKMVAAQVKTSEFLGKPKITLNEPQLPANAPIKILFLHGYNADRNHGLTYTHGQVKMRYDMGHCQAAQFFPKEMIHTFDFQDSPALKPEKERADEFTKRMSCLGQDADIKRAAEEYLKLVKQGYKILLVGESRGAAVVINLLGTHTLKNCVGAIPESPFAHTRHLHAAGFAPTPQLAELSKSKLLNGLKPAIIQQFAANNYNPDGIHPADVAANIQHNIPVFIVCSKEDSLIPWQSSASLHAKLKKAGHPYAHLLVTNKGEHAKIAWETDRHWFRNDVHGFLRHHGLPHYKNCADACNHPDFIKADVGAGIRSKL